MCGTLYGKEYSNSHIAILGLFVGFGFALTNTLGGVVLGDNNVEHLFMGYTVKGNVPGLLYYCLALLVVGVILAYVSSTMILKRGIQGMMDYSPTKYSKIIFWKHAFWMKVNLIFIKLFKKDLRTTKFVINRRKRMMQKHQQAHWSDTKINESKKHIEAINKKLDTKLQKKLTKLNQQMNKVKNQPVPEKELLEALEKKSARLIEKYSKQRTDILKNTTANIYGSYLYGKAQSNKLDFATSMKDSYNNHYNIPSLYKINLARIKHLMKDSLTKEEMQVLARICSTDTITLNELNDIFHHNIANVLERLILLSLVNINKDNTYQVSKQFTVQFLSSDYKSKQEKKYLAHYKKYYQAQIEANQWKQYQKEYYCLQNLNDAEALKDKLDHIKDTKINMLTKKIGTAQYVTNFNKQQQSHGLELLQDYYMNPYQHIDKLIDAKLAAK